MDFFLNHLFVTEEKVTKFLLNTQASTPSLRAFSVVFHPPTEAFFGFLITFNFIIILTFALSVKDNT